MADLRDPAVALQIMTGGFSGHRSPAPQITGTQNAYVLDNDITNPTINPPGSCRVVIPTYSASNAFGPVSYPGTIVPPGGGLPGPTSIGGTQCVVSFTPPAANSPTALIGQIVSFVNWPPVSGATPPDPGHSTLGQVFYNTTTQQLQFFDGSAWENVLPIIEAPSNNLPSNPKIGQLVYETDTGIEVLWNGTAWVPVNIFATLSTTLPASPTPGQLVYQTDTEQEVVWTGSVWLPLGIITAVADQAARPSSPPTGTAVFEEDNDLFQIWDGAEWQAPGLPAFSSAPSPAIAGQTFYNSTSGVLETYSGSAWKAITPALSSAPASPLGGQMYFDTINNLVMVYTGSIWQPVAVPVFSADPISGALGQMIYNSSTSIIEFWNGFIWQPVNTTAGYGVQIAADAAALALLPAVTGNVAYQVDTGLLMTFNSGSWFIANVFSGSTSAISTQYPSPQAGQMAYDTSRNTEVAWDGSVWRMISPTAFASTARPSGPVAGNLNYDTDTGAEQVYTGSTWVPLGGSSELLYAVGLAIDGQTPPSTGFLMQAGFSNMSASAGIATINFPTPFPTGLLTISLTNISNQLTDSDVTIDSSGTISRSQCQVIVISVNAPVTGTVNIAWTAIGW